MSFGLNGTVISGGNFYSVAGNVNQVFNSHAPRLKRLAAQAPQSSVVIRSQRRPRQKVGWPYATVNRTQRDITVQNYGAGSNDQNVPPPAIDPPQHHDHRSTTDHVENNTYCASGNIIQMKVTSYGESGINILYRHVVMEALHDSGERFAEPACHPGTRTAILQDLTLWSVDAEVEPILWLHGSAGIGKSAIAQMFAGDRHKNRRLGACFFFKRGHPKRGNWDGLVTTIAYQLASAVPEFLISLQKTIEEDKLIVGRSIPTQFQRLLVEPFRDISNPGVMPVVVLDSLDESADSKHQP
ncbi:hypothetical protein C8J57DRAFT_1321598 [Mycena rebaudengoi]|nr:hypothetical protein C8J57DRAFT_1321598 [Mycena rebaudengoi]